MHQLPDTPRSQETRAKANVVLIRLAAVVFAASGLFAFLIGGGIVASCFAMAAGGLLAWSLPVAARVRREYSAGGAPKISDA